MLILFCNARAVEHSNSKINILLLVFSNYHFVNIQSILFFSHLQFLGRNKREKANILQKVQLRWKVFGHS